MFRIKWLEKILKKRMRPVPRDRADKALHKLSLFYVFLGWNGVSLLLYLTWKEHIPEGPDKIQKYAEILEAKNARIIKYSGFQKVDDFHVNRTEEMKKNSEREQNLSDLDPKPTQELESGNIAQE